MRLTAALLLALASANVGCAATAYVTDQLVLGVYAQQSTQGTRLATLHSGATVDTLAVNGDATQVRLADGVTGWVKSAYLTPVEPATLQVKRLQDELDRLRATAPMLAAATGAATNVAANPAATATGAAAATGTGAHLGGNLAWAWGASLLLALGAGFWLGYAALAHRIKSKFGGIKVY